MRLICLVACTSRKGLYPAPAEFIYRSPLFSAARSFAESRCDQWFILSAKYGLLSPSDQVTPYNESLIGMSESRRVEWAREVFNVLSRKIPSSCGVVFLAGSAYRSQLEPLLLAAGHRTAAPMSHLGIGSQVAWLQRLARSQARLAHIDRFYGLLRRLVAIQGENRSNLRHQSAKSVHAARGVYFFFEEGEYRMTAPFELRVTRIGTHSVTAGSKATLWNRLRTHRGGADGIGNHRGSIFRLHVGDALIRRAGLEAVFPTWGSGQSAPKEIRLGEEEVELEVSRIVGEMSVVWVAVGDEPSAESDRSFIERNLIALLAGSEGPLDLPSDAWLGRWSAREAIRDSGLWNVNHVYEKFDPVALDVLEEYVEVAEGKREERVASRAPKGWRANLSEIRQKKTQFDLL